MSSNEEVFPESKEEKAKRIRKEASRQMQEKFRQRLHARTSGIIEQLNAKPDKSSKTSLNSSQTSNSTQGTSESRQAQVNTRITQHVTQQVRREMNDRNGVDRNERSYVDWLIAVIVIAIAAILTSGRSAMFSMMLSKTGLTRAGSKMATLFKL